MDGPDMRARPTLPPEGLTFEVNCRSFPDDPGRPHPVTVTPDWRLTTPHNLDAERIAVALGGACTCVDLADRTLPAVRGYLTHRLRLEPAAIVHADNGSWLVTVGAVGCCGDQGFPQARDAAAHLRRPRHWARRFGTTTEAVTEFAQRLLDAIADDEGDPSIADQAIQPRCPPLPKTELPPLAEPYGLTVLWDAGLHPADVVALGRALSPDGGPIPAQDVLELAYAPPGGPMSAPQAVASGSRPRGRRGRDERDAWLRAGVPAVAVTRIMSGDAYSLDDARILSSRLSRSVAHAAGLLARWQAAGMTPPVDALVGLYWGPMVMDAPPPRALVDRTLELARAGGVQASRMDAAVALVRTGSPPAALAMLADPIRRPDDPYSP